MRGVTNRGYMITEPSEHEFVISKGHQSYIVVLSPLANDHFISAIVYQESYQTRDRHEVYSCLADKYTTPELSALRVLLTWLHSLNYHVKNITQVLSDIQDKAIFDQRNSAK